MVEHKHTITIKAPLEIVWAKLIDIENWSSWHPILSNIRVQSKPITEGTPFSYQYENTRLKGQVLSVVPYQELKFMATAKGVTGINTWKLERAGDHTVVTDHEVMRGFISWLFQKQFQKGLASGMELWMSNLSKSLAMTDS